VNLTVEYVNEGPVDAVNAAVVYFDCEDGFCFRAMPVEDYEPVPYWLGLLLGLGIVASCVVADLLWRLVA
jgi:hypothetical protein